MQFVQHTGKLRAEILILLNSVYFTHYLLSFDKIHLSGDATNRFGTDCLRHVSALIEPSLGQSTHVMWA